MLGGDKTKICNNCVYALCSWAIERAACLAKLGYLPDIEEVPRFASNERFCVLKRKVVAEDQPACDRFVSVILLEAVK